MNDSISFFDHTADLGIRVTASDVIQLVPLAVCALYRAIGQLVPDAAREPRSLHYAGTDLAVNIRDLLSDLLSEFEIHNRLAAETDVVSLTAGGLAVTCQLARLDTARSELRREVKAITYHGLRLEPTADGVCLEFIVDI